MNECSNNGDKTGCSRRWAEQVEKRLFEKQKQKHIVQSVYGGPFVLYNKPQQVVAIANYYVPAQNQQFTGALDGTPFGLVPIGAAPHHRSALQAGAGIAAFRERSRCRLGPIDRDKGRISYEVHCGFLARPRALCVRRHVAES